MIFEIGGMVLSLFARPDTTKPKPINTITPMVAKMSIFTTVVAPWMSVNLKKKWPIKMINKAPSSAKPILATPSPKTMLDLFTGVAKKRLITKFGVS